MWGSEGAVKSYGVWVAGAPSYDVALRFRVIPSRGSGNGAAGDTDKTQL